MSEYPSYPQATLGNVPRTERPTSRIDGDVTVLKTMTNRVDSATESIIRHAQSLGYFSPPPSNGGTTGPTPIVTTLGAALEEHDRALSRLSAALDMFV